MGFPFFKGLYKAGVDMNGNPGLINVFLHGGASSVGAHFVDVNSFESFQMGFGNGLGSPKDMRVLRLCTLASDFLSHPNPPPTAFLHPSHPQPPRPNRPPSFDCQVGGVDLYLETIPMHPLPASFVQLPAAVSSLHILSHGGELADLQFCFWRRPRPSPPTLTPFLGKCCR